MWCDYRGGDEYAIELVQCPHSTFGHCSLMAPSDLFWTFSKLLFLSFSVASLDSYSYGCVISSLWLSFESGCKL